MSNIVTIHAIRKTSSLPKTLKTLVLSLAVSDVGVGLLVQPLYISLLAKGYNKTILAVTPLRFLTLLGISFL